MVAAKGFHDIGGKLIAGNTDALVADNTSQSDDRDTGSTSSNINDHIPDRFFHINSDTQSSSHRFMDQVYFFGSSLFGTIANSSFFYLCNRRRDTDHHPPTGREKFLIRINQLDKLPYHQLSCVEIGYHTIFQRTDSADAFVS